ncbi:MAG: hypothetical protein U0869_06490 [Chloroflexota bacterium]
MPADPALVAADREVAILERQLERMRGMLGGYSAMFFTHMRVWALATIALLVVSRWEPLGAAVLIVPFLVPFVFLEASYLFFYTVFARRHAAYLEAAIGRLVGREVLPAHRIEDAYFYDPAAPKISALSLARPLGHMSAMTIGYSAGAAILWLAGLALSADWLDGASGLAALVLPGAVLWTVLVVAYLLWTWQSRADERRLEASLRAAYPGIDPDA